MAVLAHPIISRASFSPSQKKLQNRLKGDTQQQRALMVIDGINFAIYEPWIQQEFLVLTQVQRAWCAI
jgi:hypothetical protein